MGSKVRVLQIIWLALMGSTFVYFFVAWTSLASRVEQALPPSLQHPMFLPLMCVAVVDFGLAIFLPQFMLNTALKQIQGRKPSLDQDMGHVFVSQVVRAALFESLCIFGLVVSFMSSDLTAQLVFWAPCLAGFLLFFPTEERVQGMFEKAGQAQPLL